jgi:hypothetical protein
MGSLVDGRRLRTTSGALLELSGLACEKDRLNKELTAAARRQADIVTRLQDIAAKEERLRAFVKDPEMVAKVCPTIVPPEAARRVNRKEISY